MEESSSDVDPQDLDSDMEVGNFDHCEVDVGAGWDRDYNLFHIVD